jgi:hypothetical protein
LKGYFALPILVRNRRAETKDANELDSEDEELRSLACSGAARLSLAAIAIRALFGQGNEGKLSEINGQ